MSLKEKSINGFLWSSIGTFGTGLLNIVLTAFLARILSAGDFGIIEIVVIITSIASVIVESGFTQAIIREKSINQIDLSSIYYFNLLISIILYSFLFFFAPYISNYFNNQSLTYIIRISFIVVITDSLSLVFNAILLKNMQFKPWALSSIVSVLISGIIAIILSVYGYGVWALVINFIFISIIKTIFICVLSDWRPSFIFSWNSVKKYLGFSMNVLLLVLIDKIVMNIESILIGRFYSKSSLGYYSQAKRFNAYITQSTTNIVKKVSYSSLSQLDSDSSIKKGYLDIIGITMFFIMPISTFSFYFADNLIIVLLGQNWIQSSVFLRILSVWGCFFPISSICSNIFLLKNKSKKLLFISLVKQFFKIIVVLLLLDYGIKNMLIGVVFVSVGTAILFSYYGGKLIGINLSELLFLNLKTFISTFLSFVIMAFFSFAFIDCNSFVKIFGNGFILILIYIVLNRLLKNKFIYETFSIVNKAFRM